MPSFSAPRKRRKTTFAAEALESRSLLTAGAGNMFAILPGTVATPNSTSSVFFTIDPSHFTVPKGRMVLGVDVAADPSSTLTPMIVSVTDSHGHRLPGAVHALYDPKLPRTTSSGGKFTTAITVPLMFPHGHLTQPTTYSVQVTGTQQTTGKFLVGFYLPGDATGDGIVDQTDINKIKSELGKRASDAQYTFDADTNRDGRITATDLAIASQNFGVKTNISPVVMANLDPASDSGLQDRITNIRTVHFTGQATPGASITYTEAANKTPTVRTTADVAGNYSLMIPLADGSNTFKVSTSDAFGQIISGTISPVTFSLKAPVSATGK